MPVMKKTFPISIAFIFGIGLTSGLLAQSTQDIVIPDYSAYILTPPAPETPRINSAKVFGVRPGSPVMYNIAATGVRPMTFSAKGLPKGLTLDAKTGFIRGTLKTAGTYRITLYASNSKGRNERELRLEVGHKLALTPPMAWSSWNCFGKAVSQEKVSASV